MGVIRVEHNRDYTVMSNRHLRDDRLSLRAMGLMSKMLSNKDDFEYTVSGLAAQCKEGREAVRTALKELEACGYLVRTQTRAGGSFSANDFTLYEEPQLTVAQESVNGETALTVAQESVDGFPVSGKSTQRNTNLKSNTNIPPIVPHEGQRAKTEPSWKPERFAGLWNFYPRGEKKQSAIKAWEKAHLSDTEIDELGRMLRRQMASEQWQRGIGIPYLSTYLNQRRWEETPGIKLPHTTDPPDELERYETWT